METKLTGGSLLTGLKKRQQIEKANRLVFLWVAAAAVAVTIALVLSQFLLRQFLFNASVIDALGKTNTTLQNNIRTYEPLKLEVSKLISNQQLSGLRVDKEKDNAIQVVIDAMPTSDDRLSLAASLQQAVLSKSGVKVEQLSFLDTSVVPAGTDGSQVTANPGSLTEIPFTFKASGSYDQLKQMLTDIQLSIRPISVTQLKLSGASNAMTAEVQATTFYSVPPTTDLKQEVKTAS